MKLYDVSEAYIGYLRKIDTRVLSNHFIVHNRKYICVGLKLNGYHYLLPLSHPDASDYKQDGTLRKTVVPIFRLVTNGGRLLGKILLNNMIPVPESELTYYDVNQESDQSYQYLVRREMRIINKSQAVIIRNANLLYEQKKKNLDIGYLSSTVDFALLELACDNYHV